MTSLRCGGFCVALLSPRLSQSFNADADTISTWNGGSGNWSAAGQWTPSRVPNNAGGQSYDVTIGSGSVILDISPTINSFILDGGLATGYDISTGNNTTLTVNGNTTVNGSIAGNPFYGWFDSLAVKKNLTNVGYMHMGNALLVGGNLQNSGTLFLTGVGDMRFFNVGGTLVNTGTLQWGSGDGVDPGTPTSLGGLVNKGAVFIGPGTSISLTSPSGVTDIPKGASWEIGGQFNGFSHLTGIEGPLDIEGTQGDISPLTLGSPGNTIHNSSSFTIGSAFGAANFQAGTASTAQFLQNNGTLNIFGDAAADIGSLAVGTLKSAAGTITVFGNGGLLTVGSGTVPAGTTGYYQFANGVLDAAGGVLETQGPRDLNGTLDIMLGDGYKSVGTVFTVLFGGEGVPIEGAFSNVEGLVFDGGRGKVCAQLL